MDFADVLDELRHLHVVRFLLEVFAARTILIMPLFFQNNPCNFPKRRFNLIALWFHKFVLIESLHSSPVLQSHKPLRFFERLYF